MASRRMINISVVTNKAFTDLSAECQALYFQLNMHADDDGIVNNAEGVCSLLGFENVLLLQLLEKRLIIKIEVEEDEEDEEDDDYCYETAVAYAIVDWNLHNHIANDRYHPDGNNSAFREKIYVKKNKKYTLSSGKDGKNDTIDMYREKNFRKRKHMDEVAADINADGYLDF